MSNYTRIVAWNDKDALADGDAAKIISGGDFWIEFGAVATAVNSKADAAGDIGQSFSTSTAASSSNTTVAASTAYVTLALAAFYPVGAIYSSTSSTNPAAALGGTWAAFGEGRVLIGAGTGTDSQSTPESKTFAAAATGGEYNHTVTEAEMPSHTHDVTAYAAVTGHVMEDGGGHNHDQTSVAITSTATGGDTAHNNLQPYVVVYMWERTA